MFFRRKNRDKAEQEAIEKADLAAETTVEGTAPELVEVSTEKSDDAVSMMEASEEGKSTQSLAIAEMGDVDTQDTIRLFPGFERDDFEVGYRTGGDMPSLVLRWKDGGDWFTVPALFNRGVLSAMDERDSASDLNRLLRNYGYDVEPGRE